VLICVKLLQPVTLEVVLRRWIPTMGCQNIMVKLELQRW